MVGRPNHERSGTLPECGSRLTAGSAEGLCPRCLLVAALRQPVATPENAPEPGCQIGAYRIVRLLGEAEWA